jgi:serine/threonine protein kinase
LAPVANTAHLTGRHIGVYEVLEPIGSGGMGDVYRARDTNLKRDVALKVLPDAFALDRDRLARFKREAQVLASLNHPNIAAIYGFDEAEGVHALILELVDGPTLADRIARGPIPIDETLPIASQVAEALEAAHERHVVHRDLKPANIKLRGDGAVKVLDFGLAKALGPPGAAAATASPTITPAVSAAGVVLGTAAYMSPEQAKGRETDKRTDVWAFGCVLYEMLTGTPAFGGDEISDTLAAVLRDQPDWSALPGTVSPPVRALIEGCLEKDRNARIADLSTARFLVDERRAVAFGTQPAIVTRHAAWERAMLFAAIAVVAAASGAVAVWRLTSSTAEIPPIARFSIAPDEAPVSSANRRIVAVSPDGRTIAYVADQRIYLRSMSEEEPPRPLDRMASCSEIGRKA